METGGQTLSSFEDLGVNGFFANKLKERSITKPTSIQKLVVPRLLDGKSVVFRSATGTGKTFAYLLPALQKFADDEKKTNNTRLTVLICAPTLELCSQIKAEIDLLSPLPAALLIGSVNIERQIEALKKARPVIAVGNPGRLLVLSRMGKIRFNFLRFLVLDEADRLTVQESIDETKELLTVIERSVKDRQEENLCLAACSATVNQKTKADLGKLFIPSEVIECDENEILRERIEHWALFSEKRRKIQTLRSLLSALKGKKRRIKALIFASRSDEAEKTLSKLQYHSISACGLFGKINKKPLTSAERKTALDLFKSGSVEVLVSTDLAARGLDIPGITHVIALDVPSDCEVYIHRCGRTGRAGKRGVMITLGDAVQMRLLASLEKKLKIKVQPKDLFQGHVCAPEL
jgi:superfamily II DNA/RNA helicase